jgi:quinohemoprotein ethanol dehydrogenase
LMCHGRDGVAAGDAPDLRASPVITSDAAFEAIVADGTLVAHGMPSFNDMSKETRDDIRQYLRSLADSARRSQAGQPATARGGN